MFGLIASGKRDGILTQIQARMADNLMKCGDQTLADLMESPDLIPGVPESSGRQSVLSAASAAGKAWIFLYRDRKPNEWTGAVRIATLLLSRQPPSAVKEPLPQFHGQTHPLVALSELFRQHARFGIVLNEGRAVGVVRRDILSDQILMNPTSPLMQKTG